MSASAPNAQYGGHGDRFADTWYGCVHGREFLPPRSLSRVVRGRAKNGSATGGCACAVRALERVAETRRDVIRASWPVARTNSTLASTFGRIEPAASSGRALRRRRRRAPAAPPALGAEAPSRAAGTSVRITSRSAPSSRASSEEARSLSITASTPVRCSPLRSIAGIRRRRRRPTIVPAASSERIASELDRPRAAAARARRAASRGPRRRRRCQPRSRSSARASLRRVERPDRLGRLRERRVVLGDAARA